jgi:hypothetical protein
MTRARAFCVSAIVACLAVVPISGASATAFPSRWNGNLPPGALP